MQVDIETLQKALDTIFDHLQNSGINYVSVNEDYYWQILHLHEMLMDDKTEEPSEFGIGQFTEDWGYISAIASGDDAPYALALRKFGPLLRYIGENTAV